MQPVDYGFVPDFEKGVIARVIADPILASRVVGHLNPEKFKVPEVRIIAEVVVEYTNKTGKPPTPIIVEQMVQSRVTSGQMTRATQQSTILLLEEAMSLPEQDSEFVFGEIIEQERKAAVWAGLNEGMKNWRSGDYASIAEKITLASELGKVEMSGGVDYGSTLTERTDDRKNSREPPRFATGIGDLDNALKGGLAAGELGCILGGPKHGKSQALAWLALHGLERGDTVFYFSMEMSEQSLTNRLDAAISRIEIDDLKARHLEVEDLVGDFLSSTGGRLVIKQFPPGSTCTRDLEAYIKTKRMQSITPNMIVVDYGDLMTADRSNYEKRHDELGAVYTDLRRMAVEWKVPVWTASQAKREALEKKIVTMGDIAESYKKVQICDLLLALCGTEDERSANCIRLYTAACRFAASGGQFGPYRTMFGQGRFLDDTKKIEGA